MDTLQFFFYSVVFVTKILDFVFVNCTQVKHLRTLKLFGVTFLTIFFKAKTIFTDHQKKASLSKKFALKVDSNFVKKNVLCKSWRSSNQGRIFLPFFKLRMQINFFGSIAKGFCSSIRLLWNEYPSYTLLALTNIGVKKTKK